jgi:hypothetical protein
MATKQHCAAHNIEHVSTAFVSPRSKVCKRATKERTRRNARAARIWKRYGITLEQYDAILAAQGGKCGGCKGKRSYNLHVDHDHLRQAELLAQGVGESNAARLSIRGLLCARCNKVLRDTRDSVPTLKGLVAFLADPPARKVLAA